MSKQARLLALLISLVLSACNSAPAPVATPALSAPIPTIAPAPATVPSAAPTSPPLPSATPTRMPATRPPTSVPGLVACPGGADTDEGCLPDGSVRLVGYLSLPSDGNQSYLVLNRAGRRPAVRVIPAQGHSMDKLRELLDNNTLAWVEGWGASLNPPALTVNREQAAARSFNPGLPLTQVYTNSKLGFALGFPSGWILTDNSAMTGGYISIANYKSNDLIPRQEPDPSLIKIEIIPIMPSQAVTIDQMRAQTIGQVLGEQSFTIGKWPAVRLSMNIDMRPTDLLFVQLPGQVLLVQVWPAQQHSTLLDKVIETLRPVQP